MRSRQTLPRVTPLMTLMAVTAFTVGCPKRGRAEEPPEPRPARTRTALPIPGHASMTIPLEGPVYGQLVHKNRWYLARGAAGIAVYDLDTEPPTLLEIRRLHGEARDVVLINGAPWVILRDLRAEPLSLQEREGGMEPARPNASTAAAHGQESLTTSSGGTVIEAGPGYALLDQGTNVGMTPGERVRIFTRIDVPAAELGFSGDEIMQREIETGIGEVDTVSESRCRVVLSRGGHASTGDRFERLPRDSSLSLWAPARWEDVYQIDAVIRPFLGVGTLGLGFIGEGGITYYGKESYLIEARFQPATLGISRDGNLLGVSAMLSLAYDHRFFAAGLGVGFTTANTGVTAPREEYGEAIADAGGNSYVLEFDEVRRGSSFGQLVRLGGLDGLHIELRNTFVLAQVEVYEQEFIYDEQTGEGSYGDPVKTDEYREIRWGATQATAIIPLARVTDLFFDIGGGSTGHFAVDGGVQSWLRGNGAPGSLRLRIGAGYGLLSGRPDEDTIDLRGPLFSVGLTWRL